MPLTLARPPTGHLHCLHLARGHQAGQEKPLGSQAAQKQVWTRSADAAATTAAHAATTTATTDAASTAADAGT